MILYNYIDCLGPVATLISIVPVVTTAGLSRSPLYIYKLNEAQNVAIKVCITNFIAILQWGNKGREGEEEVDYDNILCAYYKKGGKTSKSKILRI